MGTTYYRKESVMAKSKKKSTPDTGRMEPRMWRVNQRSVKFTDRKKDARRKACRGRVTY